MTRGYDVNALRAREFPWTTRDERIYLNNAGTGPLPARAVRTLEDWARSRAEPWRVSDRDAVFPALAHVRTLCARLIGADAAEIALVPNTSFGLSVAAQALPLSPGDVVLALDGEFPSVVYAWRAVEGRRQVTLQLLPRRDPSSDEETLLAALHSGVRAVVGSWVGFATGRRIDLERVGAACRERGIFLVVDAIQGLGPAVLDVGSCGADVVACGGHKWLLSPWGTGFLYVRRPLIARMEPPIVGWFIGPQSEDYTRLLDYDLTYFDDARRFEVMTMAAQDFAAMGSSLALLFELGPEAIEAHVRRLVDRAVAWVEDRTDMRLVTPTGPSRRAGIVSIAPPDPAGASQRLHAARIHHALREGAIRLSPHCYNTIDEIDAALRVLAGGKPPAPISGPPRDP